MHRVAVLCRSPDTRIWLCRQLGAYLARMGYFPCLEAPEDLEGFYYTMRASPPDGVVLSMDGVAGLNAAEHLRRLCPNCALICGSDLDFSLQAYRLRADYFVQGEWTEETLSEGLCRWIERSKQQEKGRFEE